MTGGIPEDKEQFKRRFGFVAPFTRGAYGWFLLGVVLMGIAVVVCLSRGNAMPAGKAIPATASEKNPTSIPQVTFIVSGKAIPLSAESRQTIAQQVEAIVRSSEIVPEGFIIRMLEVNYTPEQIKAWGSYLHLVYPADKNLVLGKNSPAVKEIFLGLADNPHVIPYHGYAGGSYPGYPGSICLVGQQGFPTINYYSARSSDENGDLLIALGRNAAIYPHLTAKMKATVDLVTAVQKGDAGTLKKLIAQGLDVKGIQGPEGSLLGYAENPEVAEILLQQGIPVDAKDSQYQTALIHICSDHKRGRASIAPVVTVLLKHEANASSVMMGDSELDALSLSLDGPTVEALVAAGAKVSVMCAWNSTFLNMPYRSLSYYQALVRHGLDLTCGPLHGNQGLFLLLRACAMGGKEDLVEWLLDQGVDPNGIFYFGDYPNGPRKTPLQQTVESGNAKAAKILIQHGARIADATVNLALDDGASELVNVFWEAGARPISEMLHAVSQRESVEDLQKLLDKGVPADPPQDARLTPLGLAAAHGDLKIVRFLAEHGAGVNRGDAARQPLVLAAGAGSGPVVAYLLSKGVRPKPEAVLACVQHFDVRGKDAPDDEAFYGVVRQLIAAGALKNVSAQQSVQLLGGGHGQDLILTRILLNAGVNPRSKTPDGKTALDLLHKEYNATADLDERENLRRLFDLRELNAH